MGAVKELQFGDDEGNDVSTESVTIRPVANGYIVNVEDDGGDSEYVFTDKKKMMQFVGSLV